MSEFHRKLASVGHYEDRIAVVFREHSNIFRWGTHCGRKIPWLICGEEFVPDDARRHPNGSSSTMRLTMMKPLSILLLIAMTSVARADLLSPIDSSLSLTAQSRVGFSSMVTDTSSQLQNAAINALSASVSAYSTSNGPAEGASLLVVGSGSAAWASGSAGAVTFTNMGWTGVRAGGQAYLFNSTGWTYSFTSNVTGNFVIDYSVSAAGTSTTTPLPLFGLNGFYVFAGSGLTPPDNTTLTTGLNTVGEFVIPIVSGSTYTVQIHPEANIAGGIGTTDARMDGTFDFGIQGGEIGIQSVVPEPSSFTIVLLVCALAVPALAFRRRRQG